MSGTSLDGVDAALVNFDDEGMSLVATTHRPFPQPIREEAFALLSPTGNELHRTALLANRLSLEYAEAAISTCRTAGLGPKDVIALGCHGQTLRHRPHDGYTTQINNPALLAELSGIRVIADFRSRDIAAGGQGAPLVPAFHDARFRNAGRRRVILNLGGIANVTILAPDRQTLGFDTGPANMLMDSWIRRHLDKDFDADGCWASLGTVQSGLLAKLMTHPFLSLPPPKSCGAEEFNLGWLDDILKGDEAPVDVQRTLAAFTASSVANALAQWSGQVDELYLCGGGARNPVVHADLAAALPGTRIGTTDDLGVPAESVEAIAFAWLAYRHCAGLPGNLPAVTGARGLRILGASWPA